jgi:hypothetical protein
VCVLTICSAVYIIPGNRCADGEWVCAKRCAIRGGVWELPRIYLLYRASCPQSCCHTAASICLPSLGVQCTYYNNMLTFAGWRSGRYGGGFDIASTVSTVLPTLSIDVWATSMVCYLLMLTRVAPDISLNIQLFDAFMTVNKKNTKHDYNEQLSDSEFFVRNVAPSLLTDTRIRL